MRLALIACALLAVTPAVAKTIIAGPVVATVTSVVDGDTIRVDVESWPGVVSRVAVRLRGLDTPEMRGKCQEERALARQAKSRLAELVKVGPVELREIAQDKYAGRVDARVTAGGVDVAAALIADGLARPYRGGKRGGWCG